MSNKINPERIEGMMRERVSVHVKHVTTPTNYVEATAWLDNQYLLATAVSKSVDPANFDLLMGRDYASADVNKKAIDKLWEMEGYVLHNRIQKEAKSTFLTRLQDEYNEVAIRVSKLDIFINSPKPDHIDEDDWADLHEQFIHQSKYAEVLLKRLTKHQAKTEA